MWTTYYAPAGLDEALELLAAYGDQCRAMAGGTDLILELERGLRSSKIIVDISRIPGLDTINVYDGVLSLGPLATHNQVAGAEAVLAQAYPLARACWQVGAPQIRNRATIAGNLITASPANDTITPLWAMDATVTLASRARGTRSLTLAEFYKGVRRTAMAADELLVRIAVPVLGPNERGAFLKLGLRQAQAISLVNAAVVVDFIGKPGPAAVVRRARIALGAVAPTIVRAAEAEAYLAGKALTPEVIAEAARLAAGAARPISDIRANADYRRDMSRVLVGRALQQLAEGSERDGMPEKPVMLWGAGDGHFPASAATRHFNGRDRERTAVRCTINGRPYTLAGARGKTLLNALREDAGLTGTKEGCAEGECGACTVWLDGVAVMSCLVPAERADGCTVLTVEGLAQDGKLHPVQEAFIETAAVQCGYCTPGFLMSGASLLAELPHPTADQIKEALTGNLCRCTGYYKIIEALERAGNR